MCDSVEPFIDNLWYYESVVSPKARKPLHSFESEDLPVNSEGQTSSPEPFRHPTANLAITSYPQSLPRDHGEEESSQMQDLHRVFDAIDENHDGKLSRSELCKWMKKLGVDFTEEGMARMLSRADVDRNGSLNFKDFVSLNEAIDKEGKNADDGDGEEKDEDEGGGKGKDEDKTDGKLMHAFMLHQVFELFDRDHNGLISPEELSITLENLGLIKRIKTDESLYIDMIKNVDMDGDGQVNFSEFQKMMGNRSIDFHQDNGTR